LTSTGGRHRICAGADRPRSNGAIPASSRLRARSWTCSEKSRTGRSDARFIGFLTGPDGDLDD